MENVCSVLEYIRSGGDYFIKNIINVLLTSWPFIILIIFVSIRKHINEFLNKVVKEFSVRDNKINLCNGDDNQDSLQKEEIQSPLNNTSVPISGGKSKGKKYEYDVPEIEQKGYEKYILKIEEQLRKDLDKSPFKKMDILIRDDAGFRMATEFEKIYRTIFGSQMRFLRHLSSMKQIKSSDTDKFFKQEMKKIKNEELKVEAWKHYMVTQDLISLNNKLYELTDKGAAFLTYIAVYNYDDRIL